MTGALGRQGRPGQRAGFWRGLRSLSGRAEEQGAHRPGSQPPTDEVPLMSVARPEREEG